MTTQSIQDQAPDLAILAPEVRRVLKAHAPEYFDLDADARERRRAEFSNELLRDMRADLLADPMGKSPAEIEAIEDRDMSMAPDELLRINTLMQQIRGVGEDFFSWNEFLGEGETALSFTTIGDYDRNDHECQERFRVEEDDNYTPAPYMGSLYGGWARYLENGQLRYAILSDLGGFIGGELESFELDLLQELVPHRYVQGPEHGSTTEEGLIRWNMELDASGDEDIYKALGKAGREYIEERIGALRMQATKDEDSTVWHFPETDWEGGIDADGVYLVFASPRAMDAVRPRHLLADCAKHAGDLSTLREKVAAERAAFEAMLRDLDRTLRASAAPEA